MQSTTAKTNFRAATVDDCYTIAQLVRIASDGVSEYVWSTLTDEYPGLTLIEIGAKRYANEDSLFSYKNCVLAEQGDQVVGMLLTFPVADAEHDAALNEVSQPPETKELEAIASSSDSTTDVDVPDVLAPYSLEAPGTWYICALALFPEFRNQGIGTQLLAIAHQQAAKRGFTELSLLCFEQNIGACRLYERQGFTVRNRQAVVPHPLIHYTGDILLMAVPVRG
jgi:ribosomal protein S18 acetylase RimI-like enzyme